MKKIIVLLILFGLSKLYAFFPTQNNFADKYQYAMFRSWIRKNKIKSHGIAAFSGKKIKITYKDRKVIYLLKNRKIYKQIENVFPPKKYSDIYIAAGELVYRLNCADSFFLYDFLDKNQATFYYGSKKKDRAVLEFTKVYSSKIFYPDEFMYEKNTIKMISTENDTVAVYFPNLKSNIRYILPKTKIKKKKRVVKIKGKSDIFDFILKNHKKNFYLEILNNKIKSPDKFIKSDFEDYYIKKIDDNTYRLALPEKFNNYYADLEIREKRNKNHISYKPALNYRINGKKLKFPWGEEIDFSSLTNREINAISPSVVQLLFEHRALGKKIFYFLLINDAVPSTLVLKKDGRKQLLEFESYSSLLKMLNNYFLGDNVYFTISKVKRVNGYIEIFADMFVDKEDNDEKILAQVRFQIDKNYKMKYIMLFLSNNKSEKNL